MSAYLPEQDIDFWFHEFAAALGRTPTSAELAFISTPGTVVKPHWYTGHEIVAVFVV